ncbi:hypothetical protein [uncultured Kordia sp.]|uniref:hypothetical protein n=1 Tax=uncultured Kordia sp. TaxID=507699 RepID=UPI00263267D1|nr:hypothetical protein [uncultured Kordia sp.]
MSDYKSPFIDTPLGEYFEASPKGIAFPLQRKTVLNDHPSAEESGFNENHCGEFSENYSIGKTDFEQLAKDLKKNLTNPNFIYDWKRYISSSYRTERRIPSRRELDGFKPAQTTTEIQIHRPFKYTNDGEEKVGYFDEARFNKRICSLNPKPHYYINIDTKNLEASFKIFFFYKNDREKGFNLSNYDLDNDGTFDGIPSKYIAIRLTTKKAADFLAFWELVKGEPLTKSTLKSEFKELYSKNTTDEQLNFLYSIAPVSLIKEKTKVQLWDDATRLLKYDTDRYFTDNSSNQIKVLESIADKENGMQFLYTQFEDNPKIIKDIYTSLDGVGTSQYTLGFVAPNKTIFASLLRALCNYKGQGFHRYKKFITFRNTKGYQVNSPSDLTSKDTYNVIYDIYDTLYDTNDETNYVNEERIALVQEKEEYVENTGTFEPLPKGYVHYLHPLDFVNFVIEDTDGKEITFQVPVIFLKDQAFQRNLKDLIKVIRVGLDILLVVVSVYTLTQGTTPLLTVISIIDLGLGAGDLTIQAFEEEIRKIKGPNGEPWGADFLDTWEQIYIIGGFITAVPLIGLMLKNGAKSLLKTARNSKVQLVNMLKYGIKNGNLKNFIKNPFKVIADVYKETKFAFRLQQKLNKLQKKGVLIIQEGDAYKLSYGDTIIAQGKNAKEIRKEIDGFFKGGKVVEEVLENTAKQARLFAYPVKTTDELIKFLGELDDTVKAVDLEKVGIKALFRGTTKNVDGSLFKGNTNSQLFGLSTSTDPVKAIVFALGSASKPGRKGFLQVVLPKNMKKVLMETPNYRVHVELEAILKISAEDFSKKVVLEISIDKARGLVNNFFKFTETLPTKIDRAESLRLLEELPATSLENSYKFYEELLKL